MNKLEQLVVDAAYSLNFTEEEVKAAVFSLKDEARADYLVRPEWYTPERIRTALWRNTLFARLGVTAVREAEKLKNR